MWKKRRFEKMYTTYADDIFRFLLAHTRDVELSEDITADSFAKAWEKLDTFDGKHERAWIYKIAQNKLADHWRKKKPLPLDDEIEIVDTGTKSNEEKVDAIFASEKIQTALAELPVVMRSVVVLRFMEGYSAKQTAEALNLTESNVRVVQYRALKKLKEDLS